MQTALARQPRVRSAPLRVHHGLRTAFGLAAAVLAASVVVVQPFAASHLFPTPTSSLPAGSDSHDKQVSAAGQAKPAPAAAPSRPGGQPADRQRTASEPPSHPAAAIAPRHGPGREAADAPLPQAAAVAHAPVAEPEHQAPAQSAPTKRDVTAAVAALERRAPTSSAADTLPTPRPPLPLETELLPSAPATTSPPAHHG